MLRIDALRGFHPVRFLTAALCAAVLYPAAQLNAAEIDDQRELFSRVFKSVELGNWGAVTDLADHDQQLLEDYPLWPDLRAAYFRATIRSADSDDVEAFLDQYGTLKPARELRYKYALDLVRRGRLDVYFDIYQSYYQGLEIETLDCLALQAELEAGRAKHVEYRAKELWLVGISQVEECDFVFEHLVNANSLKPGDYEQRFELAIAAREFSLARWIAKSVDETHVQQANSWQKAQNNPERFLRNYGDRGDSETSRQQILYAVERLTFSDPPLALKLWEPVRTAFAFSPEQSAKALRHIALWTARDDLPGAYALLSSLSVSAQNDEVMRWRARTSLKEQKWGRLLRDIREMSPREHEAEEWRYWRAVALGQSGRNDEARTELASLASERSYYGFLAADELNLPYALDHSRLGVDEQQVDEMAARIDLIRARELFLVGLEGRGRSEWDAVVSYFSPAEKVQAAILADRWGWHSRAISTVASVGEYDDLSIRYPLPYQNDFRQLASAAKIPAAWAYGIARSESLFMRDVRSSAGAIGLMQLMPATGRKVSLEINLPYSGLDTLTNPRANIRLGTLYLSQMAERFDGNRVLATAAYNAGPHRVDRWIPEQGSIDARIWIENIPFNETRKYVRRVMAADTIFHWRMTGKTRRLSEQLGVIEAQTEDQQLARQ
jgi:soluble lytic murein transglycosylase